MRIFGMGLPELLVILGIALLIFGPKQLPKLGSALGKTVKGLREGLGSNEQDAEETSRRTPSRLSKRPRSRSLRRRRLLLRANSSLTAGLPWQRHSPETPFPYGWAKPPEPPDRRLRCILARVPRGPSAIMGASFCARCRSERSRGGVVGKLRSSAGVSPRRVAGFACHQGFLYSLFYMGMNREYSIGSFAVERVELLGTLAAMVVTLVVMNVMARRAPSVREVMLERHSVIAYAVALVIGAFVPVVMGSLQTDELVFESIMVGVPWALMLLAWTRRLARGTTEKSTVEVFVGAGVGAALCFLVYLVPAPQAQWALKLLAIPSAVLLAVDMRKVDAEAEEARPEASVSTSAATDFSVKVLAGTVCFGLAAGFM